MADTKLTQNVSFFNAYAEKKQLFEKMDYIITAMNSIREALPDEDLSQQIQETIFAVQELVREMANLNYQETQRNNPYFNR